jgi:hypothetical protein
MLEHTSHIFRFPPGLGPFFTGRRKRTGSIQIDGHGERRDFAFVNNINITSAACGLREPRPVQQCLGRSAVEYWSRGALEVLPLEFRSCLKVCKRTLSRFVSKFENPNFEEGQKYMLYLCSDGVLDRKPNLSDIFPIYIYHGTILKS